MLNNIKVMRLIRLAWNTTKVSKHLLQAPYSTLDRSALPNVSTINASYNTINIDDFRSKAFVPETPLLISEREEAGNTATNGSDIKKYLPAAHKWFRELNGASIPSYEYLSRFSDTMLPHELILNLEDKNLHDWLEEHGNDKGGKLIAQAVHSLDLSNVDSFHHFYAPLSLFLQACKPGLYSRPLQRLYIAQAQIADLPQELRDDLPTPQLVLEAGKGDIYDANIWLGIPPTYTPLHKDPNPNLFVQLANSKRVRIFPPTVGSSIFHRVQQSIGQASAGSIRGAEMMEGPERNALEDAVWGDNAPRNGFEVVVGAGDVLFIPKGWWHTFKSVGEGVNGSVNWWFR